MQPAAQVMGSDASLYAMSAQRLFGSAAPDLATCTIPTRSCLADPSDDLDSRRVDAHSGAVRLVLGDAPILRGSLLDNLFRSGGGSSTKDRSKGGGTAKTTYF
jgi:hypothetical protein